MFLKSLEIRGFKSFADKTELKFKRGVTAVVGPNGSGKSNISDAVRWVLGEQSIKTLRGGKMEDVIFAGTQFRKPVGLAQVSLTLDNADGELPIEYNDVTVTRRIYRSGEAEYLINNSQCRLKDITTLFMDTGIGKEGYSLIGQGKIEAILSGRPEERRALLEEAAGIVKFKTRKHEAERKLDNTEQNLIRINDILSTYEERIEPLRIESEKARVFLELSNELREKEISLIVNHIEKIDTNIKNQGEKVSNLINENIKLKEELSETKNKAVSLSDELEKLENLTREDRELYYKNKENSSELQKQIDILNERVKNIEFNIENSNKEIKSLSEKIVSIENERNEHVNYLNSKINEQVFIDTESKSLENILLDLSNSLRIKEDKIKLLREDEFENIQLSSELKNNKTMLMSQIKVLEDSIYNLHNNSSNLESSLKINISTKLMLEEKVILLKDEIERLELAVKENNKNIGVLLSRNTKNDAKLKILNQEKSKLEANKTMLSNLEKQYEGYNRAVKILMEHIDKGYVGADVKNCSVIGELISVEKEFETAIEIALGGSISNVVTEDEKSAQKLIEYLKEKKLGRATFLPLTIIKGTTLQLDKKIKEVNGYIGIASELLDFDKKYEKAINYVLGRTIVSRDMNSALNIAKISGYSHKIVTLQGEVINPGGSLTGGSVYNKHTSIISRKREIEDISSELVKVENSIEELVGLISDGRNEIKMLDEANLNFKDESHFKSIEIAKLDSEVKNIEKDTLRLRNNIKISQNEKLTSESKLNGYKRELEESNNKSILLEENLKSYRVQFDELSKEIEDLNEKTNNQKDLLTSKKVIKAKVDESINNIKKEVERLSNQATELQGRMSFLEQSNKESLTSKSKCIQTIDENRNNILVYNKNIEELENKFKEYDIEKIKIKETIRSHENKIENLSSEINIKEDEVHKSELVKAKNEVEKENLLLKLNDEMSLTYAEAIDLALKDFDEVLYNNQINKLKASINRLGTVNVSAIEEYKDLSEKYKFMSTEREDLEKGKTELLAVIEEMTAKMKEVFKENFAILNENFNITFKELFKGGSAELILSDGDELTANIDINVQPPGKKLQNINLMSGGEKVLSAIALMFGILKMKPTPFCILDEIEAALDDANVYRYSEFLQKFSDNIQFIVITHRKGTMEASDIMYGVTMEERGVSKVVSVDLTN
ncbi:chromosome segregation protein SMC [Clostridium folliculivorans]|uniref:Chromosome partition protein Smc n=1 Tax=Clostridium folliculivorans TaxID=2886038 RepID=A0A9W6DAB1_9CLOT|nr:chromosome segregation protein SMC [Clostridium folliculivorans]GKU24781.1 chromosome partition protein Smc [Clostridium folliculivorans]GKU30879.1 chromosome partition protein Smc [Clostridium folliculivorans]